jgi:N6-adenosine-specific RNA methylase IME4
MQEQPTLYRTIVADPPWQIAPVMGVGGRRANATAVPYSFMDIEAIEALPVARLCAESAVLFLWSTRKLFREGIAAHVARAWGFEPVGEIIWGLKNPGAGDYATGLVNDHEPVLVATRGECSLNAGEPLGVWFWKQVYEYGAAGVPQKVHSAKPPGFLELVERIAEAPRLEMFAREARLGWDSWGDEAFEHVSLG